MGRAWAWAGLAGTAQPRWHHLHVDVSDWRTLEGLRPMLEEQGCPSFEIGVEDRRAEDHLPGLVTWITSKRKRIARLLLYGAGTSPYSGASTSSWRRALAAAGAADVAIFAATKGYFVEFNRASGETRGTAGGVSFPLTATVHSDDALTIAENVVTVRDIVDTARCLIPSIKVALGPLALYYPTLRVSPRFPRRMIAPWLAATLMYAATAGVISVTLADDDPAGAPLWLLERFLRCAGLSLSLLPDEQNTGVHAAVFNQPGQHDAQIVGVNLNHGPSPLKLDSLATRMRSLATEREGRAVSIDGTTVELGAFEVCWFECEMI